MPLRRKDDALEAGALLMDGLDADFAGWSFQRLDMDGNRRLIRDANDSLLRSFVGGMLRECCAEMSKSSPGNHSGLGDTTLERDPCPDWCTQNGVSPRREESARKDQERSME